MRVSPVLQVGIAPCRFSRSRPVVMSGAQRWPRGSSAKALKAMRATMRRLNYRNRTDLSLRDISRLHNPVLRGWVAYYGKFYPSAMYPVFRHFNMTLVAWAMRKFKRLRGHKTRASLLLERIAEKQPHLFVHWQRGTVGGFA